MVHCGRHILFGYTCAPVPQVRALEKKEQVYRQAVQHTQRFPRLTRCTRSRQCSPTKNKSVARAARAPTTAHLKLFGGERRAMFPILETSPMFPYCKSWTTRGSRRSHTTCVHTLMAARESKLYCRWKRSGARQRVRSSRSSDSQNRESDEHTVIRDGESDTVPRTLSLSNEISREDICVLGTQMP